MKLGKLIELLEKFPESRKVQNGFGNPHSWRGSYDELAFEPVADTTVGVMLQEARSALGTTYCGWKGGDFTMGENTRVNIDFEGRWSDGDYDHLLYEWMTEDES